MKDVNVNHPEPQLQAADAKAALLSLPVLPEQVLAASGPGVSGQDYWRSLEEYVDTDAFHELLGQEFPGYDPDEIRTLSRRRFIQLAAASLALAGITLTGCRRWPQEKLAPFAVRPEGRIPGKPEATLSRARTVFRPGPHGIPRTYARLSHAAYRARPDRSQ
jgi:MoCo/4Fe-4S cofactor protein with predicted Tat translocation signal